jgi:6-phosphogluconolactonase
MRRTLTVDRFDDPGAAAGSAAYELAGALAEAIEMRGAASLVVTGGRTPGPVYDALSGAGVDWSRVTLTLSDERWVDEASPDSNARLVRERLLTGPAAKARFIPLKTDAPRPEDGAGAVEARLAELPWPLDAVLLGMGDDGHVASLFPRNPRLAEAMRPDSDRRCAAIALGPDGLPPRQPRISLTGAALTAARRTIVFITGDDKWVALQRALAGDDVMEMPVRALLNGRAPVRVVWSA